MTLAKLKIDDGIPGHLRDYGRQLWVSTLQDWDLIESERVILLTACECADRLAEIRMALDADGIFITDPSGRKRSHPLLSAESQTHGVLLRAWSMLDLTEREPPKIGRPSTRA